MQTNKQNVIKVVSLVKSLPSVSSPEMFSVFRFRLVPLLLLYDFWSVSDSVVIGRICVGTTKNATGCAG